MAVAPDTWLSEQLNQAAYKLTCEDDFFSDEDQNALVSVLRPLPSAFVYAKLPVHQLKSCHRLESFGFRLIDTQVIFEKEIQGMPTSSVRVDMGFASLDDEKPIVELARTNFKYSRFHLDPLIENGKADKIKAEWVRNYFFGKRGKWLVTAKIDENHAGFLLLLKDEKGRLIIDLIAVSQEFQRKGIARAMISYSEAQCKDVSRICVGTQIANFPSINLYEKMGFRLADTHYVFHYHHP